MRLDHETVTAQEIEEATRIADPRDRMHALPGERRQGLGMRQLAQRQHPLGTHLHRMGALAMAAVHHHGIDPCQPRLRFAQGPGRQQPAVAETALGVDQHDFEITCQRPVLQAVVTDQNIDAVLRDQQSRGSQTTASDRDRAVGGVRQPHRFIAELRRFGAGRQASRVIGGSAITARDDAGPPAAAAQFVREPGHQRRLPGAADGEIAHNQHRYVHMGRPSQAQRIRPAAQPQQTAIQVFTEIGPPRNRFALVPDAVESRFEPRPRTHPASSLSRNCRRCRRA